MDSNGPAVNNRKWNLGRLGCNCSPRGIGVPPQKRMGGLNYLGDAGLPAGSQLSYTATWTANPTSTGPGWNNPNGIQSAIAGPLQNQYGVVIDSQTHTTSDIVNVHGSSGFSLKLHTLSDRNSDQDVKSIIDGLLYNAGMVGVASQIITLAQGVSQTPAGTPLAPQDAAIATATALYNDAVARGDQSSAAQFAAQILQLTGSNPLGTGASISAWFSKNWLWVALGGLGVVVVKEV
jgi:hypothetical protein